MIGEQTHGYDSSVSAVRDEYLETLYNLEMEGEPASGAVLARRFAVSRATVSATLQRLTRDGLIVGRGRGEARLTVKGRLHAERILRRHRLSERFVAEALGLDWITAHEQAHHLQNGLTPLLEESMAATLNHPTTCPHGNPIPGEVPDATAYLRDQGAERLSAVAAGNVVTVVCISELVEDETALLRYVGEKGLRPKACVEVLERIPGESGVLHLRVGDTTVAVDAHLAALIWVRSALQQDLKPDHGAAQQQPNSG